jgi:hypothetical protein
VRVIEVDAASQSVLTIEESSLFASKLDTFLTHAHALVQLIGEMGALVDRYKVRALASRCVCRTALYPLCMSSRSALSTLEHDRAQEQQRLRALVAERQNYIDRVHNELSTLQAHAGEQSDSMAVLMSTD